METPKELGMPKKFNAWRDGQGELAEEAYFCDKYTYLLDAPPGAGKSIIGIAAFLKDRPVRETLARMKDERIKRCVYLTRTKQLQEQISQDFPFVKVLKGRNNYPCLLKPDDFPTFNAEHCLKNSLECDKQGGCPYLRAREEARRAPLVVLNDAYFLTEANNIGFFADTQLLIVDECDSLESSLMGFIQLTISDRQVSKFNLKLPECKTDIALWKLWATGTARDLETFAQSISDNLNRIPQTQWSDIEIELHKTAVAMTNLANKFRSFASMVDESWLFWRDEDAKSWVFKPVTVAKYARKFVWQHSEKIIGMSGTIFDPGLLAKEIAIEEYQYRRVESTFPVENRPIYFRPVVSMTHTRMGQELPKLAAEVSALMGKYPTGKILVHTTSYIVRDFLANTLPRARLITHNSQDREEKLELFKKSKQPLVMLSPSFDRGVDLPAQDNCQCIIICKTPYMNLGDPQVKARMAMEGGQWWYSVRAAQTVVQMSGRAVRSKDQKCDTWILDSQFRNLLNRTRHILPKWWLEAIRNG